MPFGKIDKNYVSTQTILGQDNSITVRNQLAALLDITMEEPMLLQVFELLGRIEKTDTPWYSHGVNTELYDVFTINGTPTDNSGGSGQGDVTVVVTDVSGAARIREGDTIMTASGYSAYVYDVTDDAGGDQISVKAVNSSVTTANLALADTQKFTVFSRADGEGANSPEDVRYPLDTYWNQVQIIRSAMKVTDIEHASRIEFEYQGQPYYFIKAQHEAWLRAKGDCAFTLIMQQISDANFRLANPTLTDANGNPVQTTRGLDEYCEDRGVVIPEADVTLAHYETICSNLTEIRAPKQYFVMMGFDQEVPHDNMLNALTSAAQFSPNARIQINGNSIELGIDRWKLYGYEFLKINMDILNHRNVTRFDGDSGFSRRAYYVPTDKVKTAGGGGMVDRMRIRTMEAPGNSFQWKEWMTGAMAPTPNDDEAVLRIHYETIMGLECLGVEHFVKTSVPS